MTVTPTAHRRTAFPCGSPLLRLRRAAAPFATSLHAPGADHALARTTLDSAPDAMPERDSTAQDALTSAPGVLWAKVDGMADGAIAMLPNLAIALILLLAFYGLGRLARAAARRSTHGRRHENVGLVIGRLAQAGLWLFGLLAASGVVFPSVGGAELLQLLGVGSIAIGFAFKDILQNFLAGLLLLLRQPFRVGDQIVYKDYEGTVDAIDTRATLLKTYDGTRVIIPNGEIYTNAVRVNTAFESRRSEYDVGIGYGDDLKTVCRVFEEAMRSVDGVLETPAPEALPWSFDADDVKVRLYWWTKARRAEVIHVRPRVIASVKQAAADHAIDLPFPTRIVLFHDQTEAADGDRRRQREGWPAGAESPPRSRDSAAHRRQGVPRGDEDRHRAPNA